MKTKFAVAAIALILSISSSAFAGAYLFGDEDVDHGVRCKVKEVRVLAKNEADCKAIDGTVDAHVVTKVEPKK